VKRTLLKTCTYAVMHFCVAITVTFVLTGDWRVALAVGIIEPIVQTFAFALHEGAWNKAEARTGTPPCSHTVLANALIEASAENPQRYVRPEAPG
jgi:uncharacterized membrane protein